MIKNLGYKLGKNKKTLFIGIIISSIFLFLIFAVFIVDDAAIKRERQLEAQLTLCSKGVVSRQQKLEALAKQFFRDDANNFSFSYIAGNYNQVRHSILRAEDGSLSDYYEFGGQGLALEISEMPLSKLKNKMATNAPYQHQQIFLEQYVKIPAEKFTSYAFRNITPSQIKEPTMAFFGYVLFERNGKSYKLSYQDLGDEKDKENIEKKFDDIIKDLQLNGGYLIPQSQLSTTNGARYYQDKDLSLSVKIPSGWSVWRGIGDNADGTIIHITNQPTEDTLKTYLHPWEDKSTHIYIGHGLIFSTSGALCANAGCTNAGDFNVNIMNKTHKATILNHSQGDYRFSFELGDHMVAWPGGGSYTPTVTVSFNNWNDLSTIREIVSSISY